jgi:ABC-2 type transport system permease protein
MVLLFTAIFATIAVVEDRRSGFLQGVLVAPISRGAVVLGQALGGTTLAVSQAALVLVLAPFVGIPLTPLNTVATLAVMTLLAFGLTSLGLVIAWRMESTQGFHAIMNLLLLPMWMLSGAVFPLSGLAAPLVWVMQLDPLTYGLVVLRHALCAGTGEAALASLETSLGVTFVFAVGAWWAAAAVARRSSAW